MAKYNKNLINWMKQLSESYIWEMQQNSFPPEIPPTQPQPQPMPAPGTDPYPIPPMDPPTRPTRPLNQRMGQANNGRRGDKRNTGRRIAGRTTNSERGQINPPLLPPPANVNWANLWRQYSGSGYNNETLQGLYLQAQRAGYYGSFGEFYATLFAQYGGNK